MPVPGEDVAADPTVTQSVASHDETATLAHADAEGDESAQPRFSPATTSGELGRLGKYRILKELGRGGMGAVYLAFDERLQRKVALKVMLPRAAANETAKERFLREARAAAQISSDHVVNIFEADEIDGIPYIALQFLEGHPLDEYLRKTGDLTVSQIVRIATETAVGLARAHELGIVHRDIKPGNLWLEAPSGRVKILDFGLAKPTVGAEGAELTGSGAVMGTPAYMAPEQGMGKPVDGRADLFSLGCVLYRLCTGKLPFDRPTIMAILAAIATEEPPPVREVNPAILEPLADLIHRLMSKNPAQRPASAEEVVKELDTIATGLKSDTRSDMAASRPQLIRAVEEPRPRGKVSAKLIGSVFLGLSIILAATAIIINIGITDGTVAKPSFPEHVEQSGPKPTRPYPGVAGETNDIGMEFVKVPKGTAWLGGSGGKPGETKVVIDKDFELGRFEVTQEEWEKITGRTPSEFSRTGASKGSVKDVKDEDLKRFPVEQVSWDDCREFIKKLNEKEKTTGWVYRLPKEAEWEYACRGGPVDKPTSGFDFYFTKPTNAVQPTKANFGLEPGVKRTRMVGSYEANALGLFDMHGNVWEWCDDTEVATDGSSHRVYRGGGLIYSPGDGRAASRFTIQPSSRSMNLGLRLLRSSNGAVDRKAAEAAFPLGGTVRVNGSDKEIKTAAELPNVPFELTGLNFDSTPVTDVDLARFKDCANLTFLNLKQCERISDAGLAHFKDCKHLTVLGLEGIHISDEGLAHFKDCVKLSTLWLNRTQVKGSGLDHVKKFKNLALLVLLDTEITAAKFDELQKALPKCKIESDHGTYVPK